MDTRSTNSSPELGDAKVVTSRLTTGDDFAPQDRELLESLQSLRNRLGVPPDDLAELISTRFDEACRTLQSNGNRLPRLDLSSWFLTKHGELVYLEGRESSGTEMPLGDPGDLTAGDRSALVTAFRAELVTPRALESNRRPVASSAGTLQKRLVSHEVEETETSLMTADEKDRRKVISDQFTQALVQRFGPEKVQVVDSKPHSSKTIKLQPIERDRRFNWNLVLGVGSTVVILAMIFAGYQIVAQRHERLANAPRRTLNNVAERQPQPEVVQSAVAQSTPVRQTEARPAPNLGNNAAAQTKQTLDRSSGTPQAAVQVDDRQRHNTRSSESRVFANHAPAKTTRNTTRNTTDDEILGLAQTVEEQLIDVKSIIPSGISLDELRIKPGDISLDPAAASDRSAAGEETLEAMMSDRDSAAIDSQQQPTVAGKESFLDLPKVTDLSPISFESSAAPYQTIEFIQPLPLELLPYSNNEQVRMIVDSESGKAIAWIKHDAKNYFVWDEKASADPNSRQMLHGRLIDSEGTSTYFRPSIQTPPFALSLDPLEWKSSWDLGGPTQKSNTQLDLRISAPDTIQWSWDQPFDPTNGTDQLAIATFAAKEEEAEGVAIKMMIKVDCDNELKLQFVFGGRLDREYEFQGLTRAGLLQVMTSTHHAMRTAESAKMNLEYNLQHKNSSEQRRARAKIDELDDQFKRLEANLNRLRVLNALANTIESKVKLEFDLFVQWPDSSRQIILQTTTTLE
ncbi:hypothetical protein [Rhodopirellula sp. MGV]|uniref:hypothetical protein n=1 Tax=Rhodopirellula sp. MGV TaxID=2023130 RepID=UPI000B96BE40|nr:hypothetical protein [Rhodopirellula sp. MGV]OYP34376.1 hypothetical protein CGZ80_15055 [Rhodopirellula sp. MGV]PNY37448.1 hypothetical protein C2E31_07970 [Rhodopirellula baltica]